MKEMLQNYYLQMHLDPPHMQKLSWDNPKYHKPRTSLVRKLMKRYAEWLLIWMYRRTFFKVNIVNALVVYELGGFS